ncbi:MAG: hypothetical protein A2X59_01430 [Nitrospirae bacterium GWC2_42_7]|nr:MAG: hypothetical protein A2X59_01430 [Nitrospirae bacterium GWC2_42_7]
MNTSDTSENSILEKVFIKDPDIVTRKIAGELFIVPIKGKLADMQQIYTLDPVAEYIWQELGSGKNLSNIRNSIIEKFEVTEETADSDLREFISELLNAGLIRE